MAEYSHDDAQYARHIVNQLLNDERAVLEIGNDIVVYDLQKDAADFSSDLELLEDIGADVPAIRVAGEYLVPMSLSYFVGQQWFGYPSMLISQSRQWRRHPYIREWLYDLFLSLRRGDGSPDGNNTMSRDEARSTFIVRATDFLATRIAAVRSFRSREQQQSHPYMLNVLQKLGGGRVATPGCYFSVSSNSPGLRVFWSGAYRISSNYFSHPTTPVTSVLQAGTYVFGVDGGTYGNDIQWDDNAVVSLPGIPQIHLNY